MFSPKIGLKLTSGHRILIFMNITEHDSAMFAAANPDVAPGMKAYLRDQFEFLGLPTLVRRELFKPFLVQLKKDAKASATINYAFVDACWAHSAREFQYNALDYLAACKQYLSPDDIPWLRELAETKSWWETIDRLDTIIGDIVLRNPQLNSLMLDWAEDPNFWICRIAIDHQRPRKEKTDAQLLEEIIVKNFGSKEFFINKAIGWALREYSKTDSAWVADFIERYRDQLAPLSVREGSKRL